MQNREEIFHTLKKLMSEMFEIEAGEISLEASLNRDLDIDSIDAVDLMVKLREVTGRRIQPEDFKNARTVGDVVETIYKMYNA
jgi:acyl carrier protein